MDNIKDLRKELIYNINRVKDGSGLISEAEAINNSAGKIIKTLTTQLKYAKQKEEKPDIEFLNVQDESN